MSSPTDNLDSFPMSLYIYDEEGFHPGPILIYSEPQLRSPEIILLLQDAIRREVEIRITDPMDFLVFHADKGIILFP